MKLIVRIIILVVVIGLAGGVFWVWKNKFEKKVNQSPISTINNTQEIPTPQPAQETSPSTLAEPIAEFKSRITKKPFGIYITPQNSPVQPERFSGYHTGTDVEYNDKPDQDIPIYAIADGTVVRSGTASGYGGLLVISHEIQGKNYFAVYGHLDPKSLAPKDKKVTKGEQIGILGEGGTAETDGERKHLHFGIVVKETPDIKGYVQAKEELSGWLNPLELF